ncbi:MAG: hypothetical protein ACI96N_003425, partial [Arenicella sp.]
MLLPNLSSYILALNHNELKMLNKYLCYQGQYFICKYNANKTVTNMLTTVCSLTST